MPEASPRRLAAIICADVVGYSRLMGEDSERTLAALRELRNKTLSSAVEEYRGLVVKSMGDGWLIEFKSVVDAVRCATRLQDDLHGNPTIKLRIGLHVGDITTEDEDIFGDGVNIASRLQDIADPGGIVISDLAWRSIDRKLAASFDDLGLQRLKNIAEPVGAYGRGTGSGSSEFVSAPSSDQFAIAVLPFNNLSNEPEQEYFADGITEDITAGLSKIPEMLVIARNSSFAYKGKATKVQDVCRDLGVRYVLEGSVRKSGERVRIGSQLIDGASGGQLWAERYDRDMEDIFAVQDDVTDKIVRALEVKLLGGLAVRGPQGPTQVSEAYDYVLRAREQYRFFSQSNNASARALYEHAIVLDPQYAEPFAGLAETYVQDWLMGLEPDLDRAFEAARDAMSRNPKLALVQEALSTVHLFKREHAEAVDTARNWIALEPGNAEAYAALAGALHFSGANHEVIILIERAMRLNPHYPFYYPHYVGMANLMMRQFESALVMLKRAVVRSPQALWPHVYMAACNGHLANSVEATKQINEVRRIAPDFSNSLLRRLLPYKHGSDAAVLVDGLRLAGLSE
ncbi:MAG: adenylate/guanylate cyclase domain-containing protein [Hyphomicrobiaceae bacterium]